MPWLGSETASWSRPCRSIFVLRLLKRAGEQNILLDADAVDSRFMKYPHLMPGTINDCVRELAFWSDLYWLKSAADAGEPVSQASDREYFVWRLMTKIRPRSKGRGRDGV